jgi:hypothetical protein
VVELEAAGGNHAPTDAWAEQKAAVGILICATLDPHGRLLISEQERAGMPSSVRRIYAELAPPTHFSPVSSASDDDCPGTAWEVTGAGGKVLDDMQVLLQTGAGADVRILAAGGEVLKAHSQVLCARWPWFRAQQERWQLGGSTSSGGRMQEVHATEHPAAAMQAVLSWIYTGRALLLDPDALAEHTGAGNASSSAGAAAASTSAAPPLPTKPYTASAGTVGVSAGAAPTADMPPAPPPAEAAAELLVAVMHAAGAYELPDLQSACVEAAEHNMGAECALPWLVAAHPFSVTGNGGAEAGHDPNFESLKALALSYAAQHYDGGCGWLVGVGAE